MSTKRRDNFNKPLSELMRNAREDSIMQTNLIVSKGWMSQGKLAKYLGVDPSLISKRLSYYRQENNE